MTIQQTSLIAFNELNEILKNNTYKSIISVLNIWENGLTDREIAKILGYSDPNKIRPRRNELVKSGLIIENNKRICSVSKKLCIIWKKNTPLFPMEK